MRIIATALLVPAFFATGCTRPWQTARTVVTTAAQAVASADEAIVAAYEASDCEGQEDVAALEVCVEQLADARDALTLARASVLQGEAIVDLWQRAQSEPAEWRGWLSSSAQVLARIAALLEAAGVPVPPDVLDWTSAADSLLEGSAP